MAIDKKLMNQVDKKGCFSIEYSFFRCIELVERYAENSAVDTFHGDIKYSQLKNNDDILAGKIELIVLNAARGLNNRFDHYEAFDETNESAFFRDHLMDGYELKSLIEDEVEESLFPNIGIINNIEILPEYRSIGLGKSVVRDIIHFFSETACAYTFLKSFPKHLELFDNNDEWRQKMKYAEMHKKYPFDAQKKLDDFYLSCGLKKLKSYKGEGTVFYHNNSRHLGK